MSSLLAFIHHLAAFALFAALVVQYLLIKGELNDYSVGKVLRADLVYGVSAGLIFLAGLARVIWTEKGVDYYLHSAPFLAKMALFAAVGLLSIYPTVKLASWRRELKAGRLPRPDAALLRRLKRVIHVELTGVALIILCAVLMARGVGMFD